MSERRKALQEAIDRVSADISSSENPVQTESCLRLLRDQLRLVSALEEIHKNFSRSVERYCDETLPDLERGHALEAALLLARKVREIHGRDQLEEFDE